MKRIVFASFLIFSLLLPISSQAEFDIEQEVLSIPGYHESAAYKWEVERNPGDIRFTLASRRQPEGMEHEIGISAPEGRPIDEIHVFVTNKGFDVFEHFIPQQAGENAYRFSHDFPDSGPYHFEVVLHTPQGWVNLSEKVAIREAASRTQKKKSLESQGYEIKIKRLPYSTVWAGHVITLVFEIFHDGKPVRDLEPVQGAEMHLAAWKTSWFGRIGSFEYARSRQNLGGPRAGVSLVFEETGRYKIFAQFKHQGEVQVVETDLDVEEEPREEQEKFPL